MSIEEEIRSYRFNPEEDFVGEVLLLRVTDLADYVRAKLRELGEEGKKDRIIVEGEELEVRYHLPTLDAAVERMTNNQPVTPEP